MKKRRESGSLTIDVLIACAIGMMMMSVLNVMASRIKQGRVIQITADRLAVGAKSLQAYLNSQGTSIITTGSAPGFVNALTPTPAELTAKNFAPAYLNTMLPLNGGAMTFIIYRRANLDLVGLACNNKNLYLHGIPDAQLTTKVVAATGGNGMRTSIAAPGILNGIGLKNVNSPITGPSIVCAYAYYSNPT